MADILRIANCSGFFGDRLSAAREMVEGGPIDVLTGDYLAELTMAILWKQRAKDPEAGYVRTFFRQMEEVLATCVERGIKVVSNAGGLNPSGLAGHLRRLAEDIHLDLSIAVVDGDDLLGRLPALSSAGHEFRHLDTGEAFADRGVQALTANAYLGCWGITEALRMGADVVVTGRTTDAALVMGPAAWKFEWDQDDWDALAGALVAGHVVECGAQCTGGNYAFFREVPGLGHVGFPIVDMRADGSSIITKHPGSGGRVSVGTVTAQLLYEIAGPHYVSPDVVARFDTIRLTQEGADRVLVDDVRGEPPPDTLKVGITYQGGYRNTVTFVLTGLDVEDKATLVEWALWKAVGGRGRFADTEVQLIRSDRPDPPGNDEAFAHLKITVKDSDSRPGRPGVLQRRGGDGPRSLPRSAPHRSTGGGHALSGLLAHPAPGRRGCSTCRSGRPGGRGAGGGSVDCRSDLPAGPGPAAGASRRSGRQGSARSSLRGPFRRQGRERQCRGLGAEPTRLCLADPVPHRRPLQGADSRGRSAGGGEA